MREQKAQYGTGTAIAGFFLLFAALATLVLGIVLSARRTNALLFEQELERAANRLVEDFAWNNRLEEQLVEEQIVGFGIVRWNGAEIVAYGERVEEGSVPDEIENGPVYIYDKKSEIVTLFRPIGLRRRPERILQPQPPPPFLDFAQLLYLRFDATDHLREQGLYTAAGVAGPVLVGILTGLLFFLFMRNLQFRRKIAEKEKLAQLGESARTLMHEIKNPLNAINIRASILEKVAASDQKEDAKAIREEVERLRNLTEKIHTFLKDPAGEREKIEIVPFIREVLGANHWQHIELSIDKPDRDGGVVSFDRQRLRSILENVIVNALESNSEDRMVTMAVEMRKKTVTIKVLDRGSGLPEKETERLFDPFFTTKTYGSGIGLAVSRRFMRAGGGDIELRPRHDGGTEALLVFPRVQS